VNVFVVSAVIDVTTTSVAGASEGVIAIVVQVFGGGGVGVIVRTPASVLSPLGTTSPGGVSTVVVQFGVHGSAHGPGVPRPAVRTEGASRTTIRSLSHLLHVLSSRQRADPIAQSTRSSTT
jgi:hypothetical protein